MGDRTEGVTARHQKPVFPVQGGSDDEAEQRSPSGGYPGSPPREIVENSPPEHGATQEKQGSLSRSRTGSGPLAHSLDFRQGEAYR